MSDDFARTYDATMADYDAMITYNRREAETAETMQERVDALQTALRWEREKEYAQFKFQQHAQSLQSQVPLTREQQEMQDAAVADHMLNDDQKEHARIAGVDPVSYAKGVIRLHELKRQGHYPDGEHNR